MKWSSLTILMVTIAIGDPRHARKRRETAQGNPKRATLSIYQSSRAAIIPQVDSLLWLVPERRKPFLPDIKVKPFFDVKSDVNFLEKNKDAAKFLTKSQSQARVIQSKQRMTKEKTTKTLPGPVIRSGQIPDYLLRHKRDQMIAEEKVREEEAEKEARNRCLDTTQLE